MESSFGDVQQSQRPVQASKKDNVRNRAGDIRSRTQLHANIGLRKRHSVVGAVAAKKHDLVAVGLQGGDVLLFLARQATRCGVLLVDADRSSHFFHGFAVVAADNVDGDATLLQRCDDSFSFVAGLAFQAEGQDQVSFDCEAETGHSLIEHLVDDGFVFDFEPKRVASLYIALVPCSFNAGSRNGLCLVKCDCVRSFLSNVCSNST